MSSKRENQLSIKNFFGLSTTSQVSSPDKDDRNFDLNENLDILGHNEKLDMLGHMKNVKGGTYHPKEKKN